jgi:hypothetical protein
MAVSGHPLGAIWAAHLFARRDLGVVGVPKAVIEINDARAAHLPIRSGRPHSHRAAVGAQGLPLTPGRSIAVDNSSASMDSSDGETDRTISKRI